MGDYADDLINAGMCGPYPFGRGRNKNTSFKPKLKGKPHPMSHLSPDDQFSNWHDHEAPEIHDMSRYDMAACAWHEAWKRATAEAEAKFKR